MRRVDDPDYADNPGGGYAVALPAGIGICAIGRVAIDTLARLFAGIRYRMSRLDKNAIEEDLTR